MAESKRKSTSFDQVLKLVTQLTADEKEQLVQEIQLGELRHEIQKGIDAADRGELLPAEQVFAELKQRIAARKQNDK